MIIPNQTMLEILSTADPVRFYNECKDLLSVSEEYKFTHIAYFAKDEDSAGQEYVCLSKYYDDEIILTAMTADASRVMEALDYINQAALPQNQIYLRTVYPELYRSPVLTARYVCGEAEDQRYAPVYIIRRPEELICLPTPDGVSAHIATAEDFDAIRTAVETGALDDADSFANIESYNEPDWVQTFILTVEGKPAGFLRAECEFANIYDIGWVFVEPSYQGHRYSRYLVQTFARWCFARGCIPQYGYALGEASQKIASLCGFSGPAKHKYVRKLTPLTLTNPQTMLY